jgi:hypothetical protein
MVFFTTPSLKISIPLARVLFTMAGHSYTSSSFEVPADIDTPVGIWPSCRCCPDDDGVILNDAPILKDSQNAFLHETSEKAFCTKLQNSGLADFTNATTDPSILPTAPPSVLRRLSSKADVGL